MHTYYNTCINEHTLTLFTMDLIESAHGWGGGGKNPPSLKYVTYILQ